MPLAITDEASPFALLSTRNRPRVVRRGAADPQRSSAQQPPRGEQRSPFEGLLVRAVSGSGSTKPCLALDAEDPAAGRLVEPVRSLGAVARRQIDTEHSVATSRGGMVDSDR